MERLFSFNTKRESLEDKEACLETYPDISRLVE